MNADSDIQTDDYVTAVRPPVANGKWVVLAQAKKTACSSMLEKEFGITHLCAQRGGTVAKNLVGGH